MFAKCKQLTARNNLLRDMVWSRKAYASNHIGAHAGPEVDTQQKIHNITKPTCNPLVLCNQLGATSNEMLAKLFLFLAMNGVQVAQKQN